MVEKKIPYITYIILAREACLCLQAKHFDGFSHTFLYTLTNSESSNKSIPVAVYDVFNDNES